MTALFVLFLGWLAAMAYRLLPVRLGNAGNQQALRSQMPEYKTIAVARVWEFLWSFMGNPVHSGSFYSTDLPGGRLMNLLRNKLLRWKFERKVPEQKNLFKQHLVKVPVLNVMPNTARVIHTVTSCIQVRRRWKDLVPLCCNKPFYEQGKYQ